MTAPIIQIDWRPEINAFSPYLVDHCGVVQFRFFSEDCAPTHFSLLLKQLFVDRSKNRPRFSMRIDEDYASTRTPLDIVEEFEIQLKRLGIEVAEQSLPSAPAILTGNDVDGDMDVSIGYLTANFGNQISRNALLKRTASVRKALSGFAASGGRFMVEFRDQPIVGQGAFWRDIWAPLLEGFVANGMIFVHMLGPACGQRAHEDAPRPNWTMTLPTGFATDENRYNHAYDDLMDIFMAEGQPEQMASGSAYSNLDGNLESVAELHSKVAAALMGIRARKHSGA